MFLALAGGRLLEIALGGPGFEAGPQSSTSGLLRASPASRDRRGAGLCQPAVSTGWAVQGAAGWGDPWHHRARLSEPDGRGASGASRSAGPSVAPMYLLLHPVPLAHLVPLCWELQILSRGPAGRGWGPQQLPAHSQLCRRGRGRVQLTRSVSPQTGGEGPTAGWQGSCWPRPDGAAPRAHVKGASGARGAPNLTLPSA